MSRTFRITVAAALVALLAAAAAVLGLGFPEREEPVAEDRALLAAYGRLPLSFERNEGQAGSSIRFLARGAGYALGLTERGTHLSLSGREGGKRAVLTSEFVGARRDGRIEGAERLAGRINYLKGDDPSRWKTGVPTYAQVVNRRVWDGIDVLYYGNQGRLEYDYRLAPGADPTQIRMRMTGARRLRLDRDGNLVISVPGGTVRQLAPKAFQTVGGARRPVASRYVLDGNRFGVSLGRYDRQLPLVIDPVLSYSTYLGGSSFDTGIGIAVDPEGSAYVTGRTGSSDFPTTDGARQRTYANAGDAFVTKLEPDGTGLVYSTYLGGADIDQGLGIAVNRVDADPDDTVPAEHHAYVTGRTYSSDFPTTAGAIQQSNATAQGAGSDAFVAALDDAGAGLRYSTYLGGSADEKGYAIAVDSEGSAYVAGQSNSTNFPTTGGAIQGTKNGGSDAFVAKLNATGTTLTRSSYLGGSDSDAAYGIAVDATGRAYVTGLSASEDLPTSAGALQTTAGGLSDAFVLRLEPSGSAISYLTYLGGSNGDSASAIAVDSAGAAYVTGGTVSTNFPTTSGAFATANASANYDAFVSKLSATGSALVYSTYLGGSLFDSGNGIGVDSEGIAHVTGQAFSANFPTTDEATQPTIAGSPDAFVTAVGPTGSELVDSTYLGGSAADGANGIAVGSEGDAFVTGVANSSNFPATAGAAQTAFGGGSSDAFVAVSTSRHPITVSATCGAGSIAISATVSCSATVTDTSSDEPSAPTGDVNFATSSAGAFGSTGTCTLSSGAGATASCSVSYTPSVAGAHTVTATYGGDSSHSAGTGRAVLAVTGGTGGGGTGSGGTGGGGTGGGGAGGGGGGGTGGDGAGLATVTADNLGFSPKTFRAAGSGPSATAAQAKPPIGTRVTYELNAAARVRFTVARGATGRRVKQGKGKKAKTTCDKQTKKNKKTKRCVRYAKLRGSFSLTGKRGTNTFRFSGRLNNKKLAPGRYQLTATPSIAGKAAAATKATFTVVR